MKTSVHALILIFVLSAAAMGQTSMPATAATAPASKGPTEADAKAFYDKLVSDYMTSQWNDLTASLKIAGRYHPAMTRSMRADVEYLRKRSLEVRPDWWKNCRSTSNISFTARIWDRSFTANFMPSEMLGAQATVGIRNGVLLNLVTWRPNCIDSRKDLKGDLAEHFNLTLGDLGEAIVWHELGHNYISAFLPTDQILLLYKDHNILFHHLQEFYADLTASYHCSPRGRLAVMVLRLDSLDSNQGHEAHFRASYANGCLLLNKVLSDPAKFPSFHLPPAVPAKEVERNTLIYLYEHVEPQLTLAEDKALRDFIREFTFSNGESVLRRKGEVTLPGKLAMNLLEADDTGNQAKRDEWVAQQLKKAIDSGRADKAPTATAAKKSKRPKTRIVLDS